MTYCILKNTNCEKAIVNETGYFYCNNGSSPCLLKVQKPAPFDERREKIIEILEEYLSVSDEWGGSKLANWQYGHNVVVDGIEDAAEEIAKLIETPHVCKCTNKEQRDWDGKTLFCDPENVYFCISKNKEGTCSVPLGNCKYQLKHPPRKG